MWLMVKYVVYNIMIFWLPFDNIGSEDTGRGVEFEERKKVQDTVA